MFAFHAPRGTSRGFTFVEVLIVVMILGLMAAVSVTTLTSYGHRQQFNQVVYELQNGLREAQSKSRASLGDTTHGVYFGATAVEYFTGASVVVGSSLNVRVPIPSGVTVTPTLTGGVSQVVFARVTGTPSAAGYILLTDTRSFATATITISASGLVQ